LDDIGVCCGNEHLNEWGEASIRLPPNFERDFSDLSYHLTCVGKFGAVYVIEEVKNNMFRIGGGSSKMKVSWQVTGRKKHLWKKNWVD
jgi:hypothetical protein